LCVDVVCSAVGRLIRSCVKISCRRDDDGDLLRYISSYHAWIHSITGKCSLAGWPDCRDRCFLLL